jgi:hypothetical protein
MNSHKKYFEISSITRGYQLVECVIATISHYYYFARTISHYLLFSLSSTVFIIILVNPAQLCWKKFGMPVSAVAVPSVKVDHVLSIVCLLAAD